MNQGYYIIRNFQLWSKDALYYIMLLILISEFIFFHYYIYIIF